MKDYNQNKIKDILDKLDQVDNDLFNDGIEGETIEEKILIGRSLLLIRELKYSLKELVNETKNKGN